MRCWPSIGVLLLALVLPLVGSGTVGQAATDVTDLGSPTNAVPLPPYPLTGAFHRIRTNLRQHSTPELLFIGTQIEGWSAAQSWPVVKALDQFGRLSNVAAIVTHPCFFQNLNRLDCTPPQAPPGYHYQDGYAMFDWDHARYTSRYLVFVHKDLIDRNLQMREQLTSLERSLFDHYVRVSGYPAWKDGVWHTAVDPDARQLEPTHRFPLLVVGSYVETGADIAILGDLSSARSSILLPFTTIQQSLQRSRSIGGALPSLIVDYNTEANVITALICYADGLRPASVCGRSAIKDILKHIR